MGNKKSKHKETNVPTESTEDETISVKGLEIIEIDPTNLVDRSEFQVPSESPDLSPPLLPSFHSSPFIIKSASLMEQETVEKILKLIKPLQQKQHNYRDPQFIQATYGRTGYGSTKNKPKLQEIIAQHQHYRQYKQLKQLMISKNIIKESSDDEMKQNEEDPEKTEKSGDDDTANLNGVSDGMLPVSLTPAIFLLKEARFITEINGLLHGDNTDLYQLIGDVFMKMLPVFEKLLNMKFLNNEIYSKLSVIVKIQDYQFTNPNAVTGRWHSEGKKDDDIIAIGLWYFDVSESEQLKFRNNELHIAYKYSSKSVEIRKNDCVIFKNSEFIHHRAVITTKAMGDNDNNDMKASRKVLSFFLIKPCDINDEIEKVRDYNVEDYKWVNFPWKIDVICRSFVDYEERLMDNIPQLIIDLISVFSYGDEEYKRKQLTQFRINAGDGIQSQKTKTMQALLAGPAGASHAWD